MDGKPLHMVPNTTERTVWMVSMMELPISIAEVLVDLTPFFRLS